MSLAFLDDKGRDDGLDIVGLHKGAAKPDQDVVEALMHAVQFGTWAPSDARRRGMGYPDTLLEGAFHRESNTFVPPNRLLPRKGRGYDLSPQAAEFWHEVANLLLWKAQKEAFADSQVQALGAQQRRGITGILRNYAVMDNREHLYFYVDTAGHEAPVLIEEIKQLRDDVRSRLKRALEAVMRDKGQLQEVQRTAETHKEIMLEVALGEQIDYVEYVRSQVENTGDRVILTAALQKAVKALGIDDLDVELLSGRDALAYGCEGLYTPAKPGSRAKVSVPMSQYGTTRLLEPDDMLGTLAHEIAHHFLAKTKITQTGGDTFKSIYQVEIVPGTFLRMAVPRGADPAAFTNRVHGAAHQLTTNLVQQGLRGLCLGWSNPAGNSQASAWLTQVRRENSGQSPALASPQPVAVSVPASPASTAPASASQSSAATPQQTTEPAIPLPPKRRRTFRQWLKDTF